MVLRRFPEVLVLVRSMGAGLRAVLCCLLMLSAMAYAFGIGLTQLSRSSPGIHEQYFPSAGSSLIMILLWSMMPDHVQLVNEVSETNQSCGAWLVLAFIMMNVCGINLLVGILVNVSFTTRMHSQTELDIR